MGLLKAHWDENYQGRSVLLFEKTRGKISVREIENYLLYEEGQKFAGCYAILIRATESCLGGSGWDDGSEPKGDSLELFPIEEYENCPVCGEMTPPYLYCPRCGESWRDESKNVASLLDSMKRNLEDTIADHSSTEHIRKALYYSYLGAVDMAKRLGLITEEKRAEIFKEAGNEPL